MFSICNYGVYVFELYRCPLHFYIQRGLSVINESFGSPEAQSEAEYREMHQDVFIQAENGD